VAEYSQTLLQCLDLEQDVGMKALYLQQMVQVTHSHHLQDMQDSFLSIEKCPKPVISLIHGGCIGAGLDLACTTDIRLALKSAFFSAKVH
jgi:enoyl-CoA hydratase/carnithine racemase